MTEPRWLTPSQVLRIHGEHLARFGGPGGVRDIGLLEAAVDRPRNKWSYGETSISALASAYAFGLSKNHPFVDGNKRTAFAAMVVFLEKNEIRTHLPPPGAVRIMLELAAGVVGEVEVTAWLDNHTRPS